MPLSPRTKTLIALLASDNDGEALNAARMLGRALKTEGMDFHDLANGVVGKSFPKPCPVCADRAREETRRWKQGNAGGQPSKHLDDIKWASAQGFKFNEREQEFLISILEQAERRELTEKQEAWFLAILAKVKRAAEMQF